MAYKKKYISIKKEEYEQFGIYIQQVVEAVDELKNTVQNGRDINDRLNVLYIHTQVLENFRKKMISTHYLQGITTMDSLAKESSI